MNAEQTREQRTRFANQDEESSSIDLDLDLDTRIASINGPVSPPNLNKREKQAAKEAACIGTLQRVEETIQQQQPFSANVLTPEQFHALEADFTRTMNREHKKKQSTTNMLPLTDQYKRDEAFNEKRKLRLQKKKKNSKD